MSAAWKPKWHQRSRVMRELRGRLRRGFFDAARRAARTHEGRTILVDAVTGLLDRAPQIEGAGSWVVAEYPELGRARPIWPTSRQNPIFITARFRSGSTLLWNIFRHVSGHTAYYEPFNERRWFDPALRGEHTDATHLSVDDYWREYEGMSDLAEYFKEHWNDRRLYMDAAAWDPDMKAFVETLIARADGRAVLQFNRVDFRLPWLRQTFPNATILHLYRHPRDQWCSSLMDSAGCSRETGMEGFEPHDRFYLTAWARDLEYQFPFLNETTISHPYRLFYFIWKLSYVFGRSYADYSLAFERLVEDPRHAITRMFEALEVDCADVRPLTGLVSAPGADKWRRFAPASWFEAHEAACEEVLADYFGARSTIPFARSSVRASRSPLLAGRKR
jgi:hypothetical protein